MMSDSVQPGGGGDGGYGGGGGAKNRHSDSIEPAALIDSAQLAGSHARYVRVASL